MNAEKTCITGEPFCCLTGLTGAAPTPIPVSVSPYSKLIKVVETTFYINEQVFGNVCSLNWLVGREE